MISRKSDGCGRMSMVECHLVPFPHQQVKSAEQAKMVTVWTRTFDSILVDSIQAVSIHFSYKNGNEWLQFGPEPLIFYQSQNVAVISRSIRFAQM